MGSGVTVGGSGVTVGTSVGTTAGSDGPGWPHATSDPMIMNMTIGIVNRLAFSTVKINDIGRL